MTKAPFKDVKDALEEANGDLDKAVEILKQKWAAKAAKKADRETKEGIVKVIEDEKWIYGVKLACETDFVAKNDMFLELADKILQLVRESGAFFSNLDEAPQNLKQQVVELVQEYIGKIGENLRALDLFALPKEQQAYVYVHPGNRVVAIVFYEWGDKDIAKEVALQVAAMNPSYLDVEGVPEDEKQAMRARFAQELEDSGKPADIIDRIVDGKFAKAYEEIVLMEQPYIRDDSQKIKDVVGDKIKITSFKRFSI